MTVMYTPEQLAPWIKQTLENPAPQYLIEHLLEPGGLYFVVGRPKLARKSLLAFQMGMCLASGRALGPIKPTGQHRVLYLNLEGADKTTASRFQSLEAGSGITIEECSENFYISHLQRFVVDQGDYVKALIKTIYDLNIKVVFIDTWARATTGDENSSKDMGHALRGVELILETGVAVIAVHHVRKNKAESDWLDPDSDMRGSTALAGAYQGIFSIKSKIDDAGDNHLWLVAAGKSLEPEWYTLEWVTRKSAAKEYLSTKLVLEPCEPPAEDFKDKYIK